MELPRELPRIAVLNGPNMNLLGLGEPDLYGAATLDDLEEICAETATGLGLAIDFGLTKGHSGLGVIAGSGLSGDTLVPDRHGRWPNRFADLRSREIGRENKGRA